VNDSPHRGTASGCPSVFCVLAAVVACMAMTTAPAEDQPKVDKGAVSDLQRLVAIEDIRELKVRYFESVDGQDWKAVRAVFTNDAKVDMGLKKPDGTRVEKPDDFVAMLATIITKDMRTLHHGHNFRIEMVSPTEAKGRWDYEAWGWYVGAGASPSPSRQDWGQTNEIYRKTPDGWRIASMQGVTVHAVTDGASAK
jgi:ketosteroid isomerase-like protein